MVYVRDFVVLWGCSYQKLNFLRGFIGNNKETALLSEAILKNKSQVPIQYRSKNIFYKSVLYDKKI